MLAGKPDYIIQKNKKIIPVEYKSTVHKHPRKNHIYQLAAYCHLIEENSKSFVPYGVLVYNDKTFNISYDPKLRFELEEIISSMRNIMKSGKIYRNHNEINRCKNCSMRNNCDLKLI